MLVSLGADPQLKTRHGESAIDLALRYNRTDCANYLNCVGELYSSQCSVYIVYANVLQTVGHFFMVSPLPPLTNYTAAVYQYLPSYPVTYRTFATHPLK